jgi:hypothetical protein
MKPLLTASPVNVKCVLGVCLLLFFSGTNIFSADQRTKTPTALKHQSFIGSVCYIEYDSPGLDFVIMTQERPGQDYLLDDIRNQPFEFIWVHREFNPNNDAALQKIRASLLEGYELGKSKVLISGEYSSELAITMGKSDGYLQLSSINIFEPDGRRLPVKSYYLDSIVGGVIGCCPPPKKIK